MKKILFLTSMALVAAVSFSCNKENIEGNGNAAGEEVRPLDISITKNVLALMINSAVLVWIVLGCARWYKKHPVENGVPKGGVGMIESLVLMVYNDVIKGCVGPDYQRYAPYLLTAFFFILVNNLMGLIPFFPGGANVTGNIAITLVLALVTFFFTNAFATKEYWKEVFWPEVPVWLKAPIPMMPVIEFFGLFTKPFALMIRLFANIMAGHAAILSLLAIIFITVKVGPLINGTMTFVSVAFGVFMTALEVLVAFIQAYVFTMLSAVFIGLSRVKEEKETVLVSFINDTKKLSREDLPRLFDRFYVQDSARSQGGTGLGLTVAKSLADEVR